jgi:hypothetical protein
MSLPIVTYDLIVDYLDTASHRWFKNLSELKAYLLPIISNPDSGYIGHIIYEHTTKLVEQQGEHVYADVVESTNKENA